MKGKGQSSSFLQYGVLVGLHHAKVGQYHSSQRVTGILVVILLIVGLLVFSSGDGGQKASRLTYRSAFDLLPSSVGRPSSRRHPFDFLIGHVGKIRIFADSLDCPFSPERLSEFGFDDSPAPGVFDLPYHIGEPSGVVGLSTDFDFGLPEAPPLWRFAERGLPAGVIDLNMSLAKAPHAVLANPVWPSRVWLVDDTAVVEGFLTFYAHGLLSFELVSESHPGLGFGAAVRNAVDQSTCFPSVDESGHRISVNCRYRCLFVPGGQSSVSVGPSVTAIIKKD